jgi:replication factor A1
MKAGSYLTLTNAKIEMFRGNMRLAVPQGDSNLKIEEGASFELKIDNNMSMIEYELVPLLSEGGGAAKSGNEKAKIEIEGS